MSRYSVPTQHPGLTVIVGWDNPLATFFVQVFNPSIDEDVRTVWPRLAPDLTASQKR